MNRAWARTWASAASAAFLMSCGKPPAPPPEAVKGAGRGVEGATAKILAFGDSLTAGKDLEDPETQAYPAVLERLLRGKGYDAAVTNAGVSGDTSADALARLEFSLAERPDVVIVALGSNDTFQGKRVEDIAANLESILRRCRAAGAETVLWSMKTFPNFGPYYGAAYERLFARVAAETGAILAPFPLQGVAGDPSLNLPDGIHPNVQGHLRVAGNLLPKVEKALKSRGRRPRPA